MSTCSAFAANWPFIVSSITKDPYIEVKVESLVKEMSLEEKVAQMIQAEIKFIKPSELSQFPLGSVLNGGGSFTREDRKAEARDWVKLADEYYEVSVQSGKRIPLIWGTDAVHGHNNVFGATIFPHNIGLGATRNPQLIKDIARATTKEVLATGLDWVFAPTLAVVRDDRWGRTYEGYSEDPELVKAYATKMIEGMQGDNLDEDYLIATAKHFIGDGGTLGGVDQGNNTSSEEELIRLHAQGYFSALKAGAQTVMASFNSWQGQKIHGYKYLLTDVLKTKMGFDGFVIGDWNGHGQVDGCRNDSCAQAINAGVDMLMAPEDWKQLFFNTLAQVKSGEIPLERINDAVTRILRVKMRYGIFERGAPSTRKYAGDQSIIGRFEHREIAKQAVRESLVLLKNKQSILPLSANQEILVTGSGANNIPKQCGGWSLTWQGTGNSNSDFPAATSILDGIKNKVENGGGRVSTDINSTTAAVAIVIFGEEPYAEGQGDLKNLHYGEKYAEDLKLLKGLKAKGIKTVSIFITGRPLWVNPEINASDAFVVAWLPGSEGDAIADLLFQAEANQKAYDFKGKLSFSWPNTAAQTSLNRGTDSGALFPYGYGLSLEQLDTLSDKLYEIPYPSGEPPASTRSLEVFRARPITPFKVFAQVGANEMFELANGVGENREQSIRASAIDHRIQEDARLISFKGSQDSRYLFKSNQVIDFNLLGLEKGDLTFYMKVTNKGSSDVQLLVGNIKINFTKKLRDLVVNEWVLCKITKKELLDQGIELNYFSQGFGIAAHGDWEIGISDISFI